MRRAPRVAAFLLVVLFSSGCSWTNVATDGSHAAMSADAPAPGSVQARKQVEDGGGRIGGPAVCPTCRRPY